MQSALLEERDLQVLRKRNKKIMHTFVHERQGMDVIQILSQKGFDPSIY